MPQAFSLVHTRVFVPTAVCGLVLVLGGEATPALVAAAGVAGLASVIAGAVLLGRESGVPRGLLVRGANRITLARLGLLTAGLGWALVPGASWGAGLVILAAWTTDLFDGWLARRTDPSGSPRRDQGAWLDAETDAWGFLMASWALAAVPGVPGWVVLIGVHRYAFGLAFRLVPWDFRFPPWFQGLSRTIAAGAQVVLAVSWLAVLGLVPLPSALLVGLWAVTVVALGASFAVEAALRLGAFRSAVGPGAAWGLVRSMVIYHHQPGRQARLRRFYGAFVGPGALAFDVGAHVGNRVRAWRSMGCRVVAFEPQRGCGVLLDRWFGADPLVKVDRRGLGATEGRLVLRRPTTNPTLATFSTPWIGELATVPGFGATQWDQQEESEVTTLDAALALYGVPDFVKIDVEGFEDQVLAGLSVPLKALSVEFVPGALGPALGCLDRLETLGTYEYNLSLGESMRWFWKGWVDAPTLRAHLEGLGPGDRGGDLYARRLQQ